MKPSLFHIGSLPVHSYGFLIAIGLVFGVLVAVRRGRSVGIETANTLDLTFYAIIVGLIGSRLLYVLMHADDYARLCMGTGQTRSFGRWLSDCTATVRFWQGGLVFLGGAMLAAVTSLLFARRKHLPIGDVADVLAPSVSLAHVFGRFGCFLVGCCYGKPWASGAHFPSDSVAYMELQSRGKVMAGAVSTPGLHPTQLYESAGELLIFLALLWLWRRRKYPGAIALAYAFGYGLLRFAVEIFRGDEVRGFLIQIKLTALGRALGLPPDEPFFLSTAQASSLLLMATAVVAHRILRRRCLPAHPR
jgi:phosphatidylglycerol---prolipoprotein diacylglyceryl transferase